MDGEDIFVAVLGVALLAWTMMWYEVGRDDGRAEWLKKLLKEGYGEYNTKTGEFQLIKRKK